MTTLISRRSLLSAVPAVICAPAIVRAASLMPVRSWRGISWSIYYRDAVERVNTLVVRQEMWDELYSNLETVWGQPAEELLAQLGSR